MKITIKTISGKVYHLDDVEGDLTVDKLKLLTEKHTEIEPDCQRLIFKGKVLKNEQTLADAKLEDGDCIIVVKSRKKKKRSPEEKKEARNEPQAAANTNAGPPPAQANVQPNANQAFGFMMGQGQSPLPLNMNAFSALLQGMAQGNPHQPQSGAANAQPSAAANNVNAPPQANAFVGLPFAAMMGQGANNQMPDLNGMMQLLQNPMMQEMLRSPAMQQMLQQFMQNPEMVQNMMRNNPMMNGLLQNLGNNAFRPPAAAAAQPSAAAPQAAAAAPNAVPVAQPAANNAAAANADAVPNAAPAANANAQQAVPNQQAANPQAAQPNPFAFLGQLGQLGQLHNQQPNANQANPFHAFMNPQQAVRQPVVLNDAQAREMYAAQLETLQNMGFSDEARNLRALRETAGSIEAAINMLLR